MDYALRFFAGGLIVSVFAALSDVLRPKSFAGLFGAAPSVKPATLALALVKDGPRYVSIEGLAMVVGAFAFGLYAVATCQVLMRQRWSALAASVTSLVLWFAVAIGAQQIFLG